MKFSLFSFCYSTAVFDLKRLLNDLAIPFDEDILHNAGNDAYYTLKLFLAFAKKISESVSFT